MRILHINNYFAERFFYENLYIRQIKQNEITVVILVEKNFKPKHDYGPYVKIIECYNKVDKMLFFPRLMKAKRALLKEIDIGNYDIVHAYSLFTNGSIARSLAKICKKPYIVTIRNVDVNTVFRRIFLLRSYGRKLLMSANRVVFLSKTVKRLVKSKYCKELKDERCYIIPNGIDDYWINNQPKLAKSHESGELKVLYAGDINKNKNLIFVAKTLKRMSADTQYHNVSFEIIGDVCDDSVLNKLQSYDFINVMPRMPKEELIKHYRQADIFIMASINESFGLVYAEAMSQGIPVIYTKEQGFDGQFPEGTVGYHVDPFSEEDLIAKIEKVLTNYEIISANCIAEAKSFSWDNQVALIDKMYMGALKDVNRAIV